MVKLKGTKHIKSRYFFFIKDKVDKGGVQVEYRPTERMWSDTLRKPMQGAGFRRDRAYLMNVPEGYDDDAERARTNMKNMVRKESWRSLGGIKKLHVSVER